MATFDITPLFRSTAVGFDRAWDQRNTALHLDSAGYPAYNILRTGDEEFRISLAVPGFTEREITVETREGTVWVKGERSVDPNHNQYIYRGIELGGFQRTFQLPEHVQVRGARLESGMLHVDLVRELPEALRPRKIEVTSGDAARPVLEDSSKAA
ncbi:MAG: Hsp20 family protein [Pseudomonadales bacterium]|jgi:molecular chaperone IbpA